MNNNVIVALEEKLNSSGLSTIAYNMERTSFCGGEEAAELEFIVKYATAKYKQVRIVGYSYGSLIALKTREIPVICISPPLDYCVLLLLQNSSSFLQDCSANCLLIVYGMGDVFCSQSSACKLSAAVNAEIEIIEGGHFWHEKEALLAEMVTKLLIEADQ